MTRFQRRLSVWWRALRFHYIPPSYLPAVLGALAAWVATGRFHFGWFAVTVLAVICNHAALNMTDDYFDYVHAVDRTHHRPGNPYSGGSGTLTSGEIRPQRMRIAFYLLYGLTVAAGIWLTARRGWPVLAFGLFGLLSSYFYTAPPIRYGYRGFGEVSQLINFSLVIGLGSYYVQAGEISWQAAALLLPLGLMMFSMITINEIPDEREDREGGKRNLVVILGPRRAIRLYAAGMVLAFGIILAAPFIGAAGRQIWLALLPLPWLAKAIAVLRRNYRDPAAMAPANRLTIRIHGSTGILLIASQVLRLLDRAQAPDLLRLAPPLLLLAFLHLPAMLAVFRRPPEVGRSPGIS